MNVYYLPRRAHETPAIVPAPTQWSIFHARAYRLWWRVRLTALDIWCALRRGGRLPIDEQVWFADEPPVAPRRRVLGPARVLDLDAARRRRHLAAAAGV
jgi:hypothetical protein